MYHGAQVPKIQVHPARPNPPRFPTVKNSQEFLDARKALEQYNTGGPVQFIGDVERLLQYSAELSRMAALQEKMLQDRDSDISRIMHDLEQRSFMHEQECQNAEKRVRLTEGEAAAWLLRGKDMFPRIEVMQKERAEFNTVEMQLSEHTQQLATEVSEHPDRLESWREMKSQAEQELFSELKEARSKRDEKDEDIQEIRSVMKTENEELKEVEAQTQSRSRARATLVNQMQSLKNTLASEQKEVKKLEQQAEKARKSEEEAAATKKKIDELKRKQARKDKEAKYTGNPHPPGKQQTGAKGVQRLETRVADDSGSKAEAGSEAGQPPASSQPSPRGGAKAEAANPRRKTVKDLQNKLQAVSATAGLGSKD